MLTEMKICSCRLNITLSNNQSITSPSVSVITFVISLKSLISQTLRYMEEIVENTLSLLSVKHDQSHLISQTILDPIYFFALVDTKAVWFKKWMVRKYFYTLLCIAISFWRIADVLVFSVGLEFNCFFIWFYKDLWGRW